VDSTFSIDVENGNINLARRLDWEAHRDYNLTVMVTDGVHETLTVVSSQRPIGQFKQFNIAILRRKHAFLELLQVCFKGSETVTVT
jgi:hypothetical protein